MTNLLAYGGEVWLVTVTAPGADVLPWDHETGRVQSDAADEWNRTAAKRWRELHRWAQQATAREGEPINLLARVWQLQTRGVLHVHLVLGFNSPAEKRAAWSYVRKLRERNADFGFGFVDARDRDGKRGRSMVMQPHRAAGYLSRYLGESAQLREAIALEHRPRQVIYIARSLTSITSCTFRRLRRARYLYVLRLLGERAVFAKAGQHPAWFRDATEYGAVAGLLRASPAV